MSGTESTPRPGPLESAKIADAHRAWPELGPEAATDRLSEDLIDVFAAAGTPEAVHERLRAYVDVGLDGVLAWWSGLGADPEAGLRLLAAEVSH